MICSRLAILFIAFLSSYLPAKAAGAIRDSLPDEESKKVINYTKGFFVGLALGPGVANKGCTQCYPDQLNFGYYFRGHAGYRINRKFAVAMEPAGWEYGYDFFGHDDPKKFIKEIFTLNLSGYYFPFPSNRLFTKLSLGASNFSFTPDEAIQLEDDRFTLGTIEHIGFSMSAGIGIELPVSLSIYLVPGFDYTFMPFDRLETLLNEPVIGGLNAHLLSFSIGFNFYPGAVKPVQHNKRKWR